MAKQANKPPLKDNQNETENKVPCIKLDKKIRSNDTQIHILIKKYNDNVLQKLPFF